MYLLDTDILIDYLRLYEPALDFFQHLSKTDRTIALLTRFELLNGCQRKEHEMRIDRFLRNFKVYTITGEISKEALHLYHNNRWFTGLGISDSFIAATALVEKRTLFTRNYKHYQKITGLKVEVPYG